MADSEKLDNQRLKNFKNKGRDLEVKVVRICGEDVLFSSPPPALCSRPASPPGFPVTSFLISTIGELCAQSLGQGLHGSPVFRSLALARAVSRIGFYAGFLYTERPRWL